MSYSNKAILENVEEELKIEDKDITSKEDGFYNQTLIGKIVKNNSLDKLKNIQNILNINYNLSLSNTTMLVIQILCNAMVLFSPIAFFSTTDFLKAIWTGTSNTVYVEIFGAVFGILAVATLFFCIYVFYRAWTRKKIKYLTSIIKISVDVKENCVLLNKDLEQVKLDLNILKDQYKPYYTQNAQVLSVDINDCESLINEIIFNKATEKDNTNSKSFVEHMHLILEELHTKKLLNSLGSPLEYVMDDISELKELVDNLEK